MRIQGTRLCRSVPVGTAVKCEPDDHGAGQPARGRLKGCRTSSRRVDRPGGPRKGEPVVEGVFWGCRRKRIAQDASSGWLPSDRACILFLPVEAKRTYRFLPDNPYYYGSSADLSFIGKPLMH
jgi:hypothetical protein